MVERSVSPGENQPPQTAREKFTFQTAKLEIVTKTEFLTKKDILIKSGFFGFVNELVEVEKLVKVETPAAKITRISGEAEYITEDLGSGVKLEMVYIPAGSCMMGSNENEYDLPIHRVNLAAFYMGKYPVTQQQYQAVMGTNPAHFKGSNRPVECVSWDDGMEFCQKLSQLTGHKYSLPSESQWEYACRAGTITPFCFGETISTDLANYNGNGTCQEGLECIYREQTTPVGEFPPNAFGLYDMHGNVWEWCLDTWHEHYNGAPTDGSAWIKNEYNSHLLRGGSWVNYPDICCSSCRNRDAHDSRSIFFGFRVVYPA
jgi:eukaryotic-like serine/threonine-protein kinase